jgi:TolA-binding protein
MKIKYIIIVLIIIVSGIYFLNTDDLKQFSNEKQLQKENEPDIDLHLKGIDLPKEIKEKIKNDIKNTVIPKEVLKLLPKKLKPIKNATLNDSNYLQKGKLKKEYDHWGSRTAGFEIPDSQWQKMIKRYSEDLDLNNRQDLSIRSSELLNMGVTKLMKRDYKKAEHAFSTIINKFPNSEIESKARIFLIETFHQQKRIQEAIQVIQTAYEQYGDDDHYVNLLSKFNIVDIKTISRNSMKKTTDQITKNQYSKKQLPQRKSQTFHSGKKKSYFPGDINRDGILNEKDSLCAYEVALSITPTSCGNNFDIKLCDINGDNKCTNEDAICIYNKSLGLPCSNETLPGDMDKDGILTNSDALCAHELSLSICPTSCGKDCNIKLCDVNADNKCTKEDVICIYNRSLGLECK